MWKRATGEPYAGEPPRFGGRGGAILPYPYLTPLDGSRCKWTMRAPWSRVATMNDVSNAMSSVELCRGRLVPRSV